MTNSKQQQQEHGESDNAASCNDQPSIQELNKVRPEASKILSNLEQESQAAYSDNNNNSYYYESWVRGQVDLTRGEEWYPSDRCRFFDRHGFIHVKNFADSTEIQAMKQQMADLTRDWDPQTNTSSFSTDEESNKAQGSNDYFLESASQVHFFAEPHALDENSAGLKPHFLDKNKKMEALNKAGHGMHNMIPGAFFNYSTSDKVKQLVHELGWTDPVVPQSMYIFKQANIGGAVNSHQDSTFLHTEPRQSCLGLWLALDDATLENGCLWVRPGSHQEKVRRRFVRNVQYFGQESMDRRSNVARGDLEQPKMIMNHLEKNFKDKVPWEGLLPKDGTPQDLLEVGFCPVECKAGDLLAFGGQLDHLSLPNHSNAPRHTFQLHLVEGPEAGVTWSKTNWLQYPHGKPFVSIKMN